MIYLYIKESPLGLKYLGKTEKDPFKYIGSGLYWKKHLKKHKFTYEDIKTTILLKTEDKEELKNKGIYYSELYDIVNNEDWANLRPENGDGGNTSMCTNYKKPPIMSGDTHWTKKIENKQYLSEKISGDKNPAKKDYVKEKIRLKSIGRKASVEVKQMMSENRKGEKNAYYGKKHTDEIKIKMKERAKGKYTLKWFIEKYDRIEGNIKYKEKCEKLKGKRNIKYNRTELKCPYCNLVGKGPNMKRYHFEKCKIKY